MPAYWIVDPERHCVEVWTPEATFPTIEWEPVSWRPAAAVEPLRLPLTDAFKPI